MIKITIDPDKCIGCGACVSSCPEVFDFNNKGFGSVKDDVDEETKKEHREEILYAIENCPTEAIEEVK